MAEDVRETTSMDDTIRELLNKSEEPETIEAASEEPVQEETEKPARVRDATGKFAKKDSAPLGDASQSSPQSAEAAPEEAAEPPLVTTQGTPIDLNRAPASWKPAAKAAWTTIPEPVRQEIYRRESDFLHGNKGLKETADFGQAVRQVIEPYRMLMEGEPTAVIGNLLRTAAILRTGTPQQKLQAMAAIDRDYAIGYQQMGQQPQMQQQMYPASSQDFRDPRLDTFLARMEQQEQAVTNGAIERFMSAKGEKNEPLYPFVDNVLEDMVERVSALRRANPSLHHDEVLKKAYEAACWADPDVRNVLIGQQQAQQRANEETLRRAEAAKRASAANLPKRGSVQANSGKGATMDETIRETLAQLQANV